MDDKFIVSLFLICFDTLNKATLILQSFRPSIQLPCVNQFNRQLPNIFLQISNVLIYDALFIYQI